MKDYYKILNVSKTATKDEIKKSFRDLSKEHHPDCGGDEEKFKEINEAYSVLSDDNKRAEYDNPMPNFSNFSFNDIFYGMAGINRRQNRPENMPMKGRDLKYMFDISLYESICGVDRKFEYEFEDVCNKCKGLGGVNKQNCVQCNGTGMITRLSQSGNMKIMNQTSCAACYGRGFMITDKCEKCDGSGKITRHEQIVVKTEVDVPNGVIMRFDGMGGIGLNNGPSGDLLLKLNIKIPKKKDLTEEQLEVLKKI